MLALVAFLYASVGHGGASGYLAVILLLGFAPADYKTTVLWLNIVVSGVSFIGYYRAKEFLWHKFWPFTLTSVPMAFVGGSLTISDTLYKKMLAICLLVSIARLLFKPNIKTKKFETFSIVWAMFIGAGIGLLSGMLGIGGGILLSPLLLLLAWTNIKQTAAISALFIFVNSLAAIIGQTVVGKKALFDSWQSHEGNMLLLSVFVGGLLGSYFGSKKFAHQTLQYLLALGLCIASAKLFFS
jgi:uncharacterized protein